MTPVEMDIRRAFALGLRIASKANAKTLTDDLFIGECESLFSGTSEERTSRLREWLNSIGVDWLTGEIVDAVAVALRMEVEHAKAQTALRSARREIDRAEMDLRYPNISGAERVREVVKALFDLIPPAPPRPIPKISAPPEKSVIQPKATDVQKPEEPKR